MYIDCTSIAQQWENEIRGRLMLSDYAPTLAIITSDYDDASKVYVRNKVKIAQKVGINAQVYDMSGKRAVEWTDLVKSLNEDLSIDGIIIQLPTPEHIVGKNLCADVVPWKDVDGLSNANIATLASGNEDTISLTPCTPKGILYLMNALNVPKWCDVVIVGRSNLVGRPLAHLLTNNDYTVTLCHSKTENLQKHLERADVIISAVGKPKFITGDLKGKLIIDVGINRDENGKLCGDVDPKLAEHNDVTPVPKGVGQFTVLALMDNLV